MATTTYNKTPLSIVIADYEQHKHLKFMPEKSFYDSTGINRIRFWQLVRGEKAMLINEAQSLAEYFEIPVSKFFS
ncbi:hypothetical protein [Spirosoma sp. KNUC1025]|uniref:hypothetical protein n=1 Tax=Spirosoma sp. KNUC1025 TaxID=2894082 RepID=UPI003866B1F7|nr:hypothetical protein LN737_17380 [Spirosoma sp. KNUC1025]